MSRIYVVALIICSLIGLARTEIAVANSAGIESCQADLEADYKSAYDVSTTFLDEPILTIKAERGSLESRYPGLVKSLIRYRRNLIAADLAHAKHHDQNLLSAALDPLIHELEWLTQDYRVDGQYAGWMTVARDRMKSLREQLNTPSLKLAVTNNALNQIESSLWEIAIACLVHGHEIHLNRNLSDLYPEFENLTRQQRQDFDREIDIAIKNEDGSWRWIEIKDWNLESMRNASSIQQLLQQAHKQSQARELFTDHRITKELWLKYAPDARTLEDLVDIQGVFFDRLVFVFPETPDADARKAIDLPSRKFW